MSKRSHSDIAEKISHIDSDMESANDSGDSSDMDIVNVDFDFFDPKDIDFHAIKRMMATMFGDDQELFNTSELAELITEQKLIGSTVKVSGEDDPYAIFTVLNMTTLKDKQVIKQLKEYLISKSSKVSDQKLHENLSSILNNNDKHVGLLINERLTNMPAQIVPPMLKMLVEELDWAIKDNEPYNFEYYIMLAPIYQEIAPTISDDEDNSGSNRELMPGQSSTGFGRKKKSRTDTTTFYFHPEDEFIEPLVTHKFDFKFSKSSARAPETRNTFTEFGISPLKRCFIIHKSQLLPIYNKIEQIFKS
ncbi:Protein bcp1 [Smittium culicis]|uniref:Protein BCP1 n=1 Tax=Smittium culicis TaxID=133412 RepID=A0A1R1XH01_9FUNG|nr:Protein bcp1 [Smittium culicis]OMJ26347.1 Protein bcp1 [Smittium culicis]